MERIRLTKKVDLEKTFILALPVVLSIFILSKKISFPIIVVLSLLFLFSKMIFSYLNNLKTIDFDNNFIYIVNVNNEDKIKLENIRVIRRSMSLINKRNIWEMEYLDNDGKSTSISFVPNVWDNEIFKLEKYIIEKNPDAIINNFTSSI